MQLAAAPPLPGFLAGQLPFHRAVYTLRDGPDAGRRIHFIDHGDPTDPTTRPVLMLHGNPTWSYLWRKVIALLPGYRCVAPDLLGLGLSDRLDLKDHTVDRHGRAIAELVEALDLRGIVLIAQDWGGPIAMQVGLRHPDRIAAVILANTAVTIPSHPRGTWFHKLARVPILSDLLFRGLGFPQIRLSAVQGDKRSIRGDVARAYTWPLHTWKDRAAPLALARMVPNGPNHPSMEALRRGESWILGFKGPMALVWGLRDPLLGRALRHHEKAFPNAKVTRTEAGHFLQEEVPEALAAAVDNSHRTDPVT
ncbi:MAG TPA: alpha/beta fold hydrolase [Thermoanaerobaculia bacterium]